MANTPLIVMVSTGLGRVNRGFEQYIHSLASYCSQVYNPAFKVLVYGSKKPNENISYDFRPIPSVKRDGILYKWIHSSSKRLRFERFTFWFCMVPFLWKDKPDAIYLGEYPVYGWLFHLRKRGLIKASLALYTGGQAIPGPQLFDPKWDYIHHITDAYFKDCLKFPADRQQILPHFIDTHFGFDFQLFKKIKAKAGVKKIVLSVGAIEKSSKRMDLLLQALAPMAGKVFPVLLGEPTADSAGIEQMAAACFGAGGYLIQKVPYAAIGTWYQAADIFVLCSPKESFGLALVEALFHGLPVACYRFAETEFVMQQHAKWLVSVEPACLAVELEDWFKELPEFSCRSIAYHQFVFQQYSVERLGQRYFDMFSEILKNHAG